MVLLGKAGLESVVKQTKTDTDTDTEYTCCFSISTVHMLGFETKITSIKLHKYVSLDDF